MARPAESSAFRPWHHAWVRRPLVVALAMAAGMLAGAVLLARTPFTVDGSAEHSPPLSSWSRSCPNDDGEAVASGQSAAGARERCVDAARRRLLGASAVVAVAGVELTIVTTFVARNAEPKARQESLSPMF